MTAIHPDATTTGVPSNVTLKQSGSLVITTPGAVIEGLDINGSVIIDAPNVTLKNCKISDGGYDVVLIRPGITGTVVQNCDIDNQGSGGQGIAGQGTFLNNNIHGAADGIDVRGDNTVIRDNFIHDMQGTSDSHYDGIQADGSFSNLTIEHNTIINEHGQTSAIMLDNYWGPIDNVKIDDNLLSGGGFTTYLNEVANGQPGGGPVTNVSYTNNHIDPGQWGAMDLRTELGNTPYMSGNTQDGAAMVDDLQMTGQPSSSSSSSDAVAGTADPAPSTSDSGASTSDDSGAVASGDQGSTSNDTGTGTTDPAPSGSDDSGAVASGDQGSTSNDSGSSSKNSGNNGHSQQSNDHGHGHGTSSFADRLHSALEKMNQDGGSQSGGGHQQSSGDVSSPIAQNANDSSHDWGQHDSFSFGARLNSSIEKMQQRGNSQNDTGHSSNDVYSHLADALKQAYAGHGAQSHDGTADTLAFNKAFSSHHQNDFHFS